jgi:hypothetical protein
MSAGVCQSVTTSSHVCGRIVAHLGIGPAHASNVRDGLLMCVLHSDSTWSDGYLTLPDLVDVDGGAGFDVLSVVDYLRSSGRVYLAPFSLAAEIPLQIAA